MNVEKDFLTISCANLSRSIELFGGSGAYQGSKEGSELNNFCVEHAGKSSIVMLDEFDKLEADARDGFYTIFDKGSWINKRLSRFQSETIDCKKTIWLLTTNVFDKVIESKQELIQNEKAFQKFMQSKFKQKWGAALGRRITAFLPYVHFTPTEAMVLAETLLDNRNYNNKIGKDNVLKGVKMQYDDQVIEYLASQYIDDKESGVTGIDSVISKEIICDVMSSLLVQPAKKHYALQVETTDDETFISVN